MNKLKIFLVLYYLSISVLIIILAVVIPFQLAEKESLDYMNSHLSDLKQEKANSLLDEKNEAVTNIIKAGAKLDKERFESLSGQLGLLAAILVSLLTFFLPFTHPSDFLWIGAGFSVLYGLGPLNSESFIGILLLIFMAYFVKKLIKGGMN